MYMLKAKNLLRMKFFFSVTAHETTGIRLRFGFGLEKWIR